MRMAEPGRTGRIVRRLVLMGGLALATGCITIPLGRKPGSPTLGPTQGSPAQEPRRAPSLKRKRVTEKQDPNILWAADRTRCEVDPKKFESTKEGDAVWCVWKQ